MSRQITPFVQGFNNVAAGGMATTRLPRNRRYHALALQYKTNAAQATIEADLTQIRILVNNKTVRTFSAVELFAISAFCGFTFQLGMLPIFFSDPRRRTPEGEEFLAWLAYEAVGVGDIEIQVDISGGAAAPTLTGIQSFDYERPFDQFADVLPASFGASDQQRVNAPMLRSVMHWVRKIVNCNAAFTAASPLSPVNTIPSVNGWLHKVHAFDPVVTGIAFRNGETPFYGLNSVQLNTFIQPYGMAKQANVMHAAIDNDQQYVDGIYIPVLPSLTIDFTTSAAATANQFVLQQEIRKPFDLS